MRLGVGWGETGKVPVGCGQGPDQTGAIGVCSLSGRVCYSPRAGPRPLPRARSVPSRTGLFPVPSAEAGRAPAGLSRWFQPRLPQQGQLLRVGSGLQDLPE